MRRGGREEGEWLLLGAVVVWLPIPVSVFGGFYFSYNQYEYVDVHPDCWLLSGEMMKRRRRRRGEGEEEEKAKKRR